MRKIIIYRIEDIYNEPLCTQSLLKYDVSEEILKILPENDIQNRIVYGTAVKINETIFAHYSGISATKQSQYLALGIFDSSSKIFIVKAKKKIYQIKNSKSKSAAEDFIQKTSILQIISYCYNNLSSGGERQLPNQELGMNPETLLSNYLIGQPLRLDFLNEYDGDVIQQLLMNWSPQKFILERNLRILEFNVSAKELFYLGYYFLIGQNQEGDIFKFKSSNILYDLKKVRQLISQNEQFITRAYKQQSYQFLLEFLYNEFQQSLTLTTIRVLEEIQQLRKEEKEVKIHNDNNKFQVTTFEEVECQLDSLLLELQELDKEDDITSLESQSDQDDEEMIESNQQQHQQQLQQQQASQFLQINTINHRDDELINDTQQLKQIDELIVYQQTKEIDNQLEELDKNQEEGGLQIEVDFISFQLPDFQGNQQSSELEGGQQSELLTNQNFPPQDLYQLRNQHNQNSIESEQIRQILSSQQFSFLIYQRYSIQERGNQLILSQLKARTIYNNKIRKSFIDFLIIKKTSRKKKKILQTSINNKQPKPKIKQLKKRLRVTLQKVKIEMSQSQKQLPPNFLKIIQEKPNNTERLIIDSKRESPSVRKKLLGPQAFPSNLVTRRNTLNKSVTHISQVYVLPDQQSIITSGPSIINLVPRTLESTLELSDRTRETQQTKDNFNNQQPQDEKGGQEVQQPKQTIKNGTEMQGSNIATNGSQFPVQLFQSYIFESKTFIKEELIDYNKSNSI